MTEKKSFGVAFALWLFFGGLGAHRVYIKESPATLLWYWLAFFCTFSIIAWIDVFRLKDMIRDQHDNEIIREKALRM